jgi:hypothetical protein
VQLESSCCWAAAAVAASTLPLASITASCVRCC